MKRLIIHIFPLILLAAVLGFFVKHPDVLREHRNSWTTLVLPYLVLGFAALLAWRFNKSMLALSSLTLGLLHLGLTRVYDFGPLGMEFRLSASLVLPVFFVWFYLGRDRGMLSEHGLFRFFVLLFVCLTLALSVQFLDGFPSRWLPSWLLAPTLPTVCPVPRVSTAVFFLCWVFLVYPSAKTEPVYGPLLAGVLVSVFATFVVIHEDFAAWRELGGEANRWLAGLSAASFTLMTAAVVELYAVLEISHGTAFVDQLTQLPGRRALDYRLATLGPKYAIAMVDIDHFKKVNDRHGHDVGDQALRFIAAKLRHVRDGRAYRYGGEEFAVIFPKQTVDQVTSSLNALREGIHKSTFVLRDNDRPMSKLKGAAKRKRTAKEKKGLTLTISVGVADSFGEDSEPQDVIINADKALYKAKKDGRNRVEAFHNRKLDIRRVVRSAN
ncbi:MAG: GGDEF domain-containing protein [Lentisphaeria bacterium]|nr:GGDEF domain-containing protein [Lentisphaeria bacterium]